MAIARIEHYNGSPALMIDGKPYPPMCATICNNAGDHMIVDAEYYKKLGESGIKVFFLICDTEWLKPGAFQMFCDEAEILLKQVPDAYIILRIGMHAPVQWCNDNPDETLTYSDGKKKATFLPTESFKAEYPQGIYSFCSQKWREDAGAALMETYKRVEASPYGDRVIGYFFGAGGTSEWYYLTPLSYTEKTYYGDSGGFCKINDTDYNGVYADLSPAFKREFSLYLKEKYGTDENLRRAWKDAEVTIADPKIPDCDARYFIYDADFDAKFPANFHENPNALQTVSNGTNIGQFIDIDKRRDVVDFFHAIHWGTANAVIHFGNIIKSLDPNKVTGAFYGAASNTRYFDFAKIGSTDYILQSGKIDFLASPGVYENRQPGGFTGQKQVFDSFRLKNTIFLVEDDVRTHLEKMTDRTKFGVYDINDSINVMKRDFGRNVCQDIHAWWFDQHVGGGRYRHPELYKLITQMQRIARESYECDRRKNSEIALIYDEESYHVISEAGNQQLIEIFKNYDVDIIGAPSDRYFHNDMANPDMPDYKLYIFFNCLYLTDEERNVIKKKLAKNHATALFMYAAGIINPDCEPAFSEKHTEELTGIKMGCLREGVYCGKFKLTGNHPIAGKLNEDNFYGDFTRRMQYNTSAYIGKVRETPNLVYPLVYADDDSVDVIGYFPDSEKSAMVVKDVGEYNSVYCGAKYITNDVVRAVAEFAGCHIYCDSDDVLYANRNYITFHAATSGEKVIKLPEVASAFEVYEETYYSNKSKEIKFKIKKGQTVMFKLERENI